MRQRAREAPLRAYAFDRNVRRVGYRRFGREGGKPVRFFHGPSFGAGEYSEDRILADRHGLAVYAIERPGYGRTDPASEAEGAAECEHKDTMALVRSDSLGRFYILAHEAGLIPALEFTRREADRPLGILAVSSSPPFIQLEQIDAIPAHQGIYLHAARRAPWLARLFLRLLAVRMQRLGPQVWPEVIFKGQDFESAVMAGASLTSGVNGSYSFYLNQAYAGFEHYLRLMLGDWGDLDPRSPDPADPAAQRPEANHDACPARNLQTLEAQRQRRAPNRRGPDVRRLPPAPGLPKVGRARRRDGPRRLGNGYLLRTAHVAAPIARVDSVPIMAFRVDGV